jgi:hypothetical protein
MSSGCYHPKIHSGSKCLDEASIGLRSDWVRRCFSPRARVNSPSGGQKTREPISFTDSASQTSVKFVVNLLLTPPAVNNFFTFFGRCCSQQPAHLINLGAVVNCLITFFQKSFAASDSNSTRKEHSKRLMETELGATVF